MSGQNTTHGTLLSTLQKSIIPQNTQKLVQVCSMKVFILTSLVNFLTYFWSQPDPTESYSFQS